MRRTKPFYSPLEVCEMLNKTLKLEGREVINAKHLEYWRSRRVFEYDRTIASKQLKELKRLTFLIRRLGVDPGKARFAKDYLRVRTLPRRAYNGRFTKRIEENG